MFRQLRHIGGRRLLDTAEYLPPFADFLFLSLRFRHLLRYLSGDCGGVPLHRQDALYGKSAFPQRRDIPEPCNVAAVKLIICAPAHSRGGGGGLYQSPLNIIPDRPLGQAGLLAYFLHLIGLYHLTPRKSQGKFLYLPKKTAPVVFPALLFGVKGKFIPAVCPGFGAACLSFCGDPGSGPPTYRG